VSATATSTVQPARAPSATATARPSATPTTRATPTPTARPAATASPTATTRPVATATPQKAAGSLLRQTTYESGAPIVEEQHSSTAHALGTTSAVSRLGARAGFALLKPGDPRWHAGGFRAEWQAKDHTSGPGAERWHGISFYFPEDYNQGSNPSTWDDRIIFQFVDEGSPMLSLHIDAARQQLWVRRKAADGSFHSLGRWSFETERWYDIVFHSVWQKDASGRFEVFVDGTQRVSYTGPTLAVRDTTYSKWGIYGQPTHVIFDEVRIAEGSNLMGLVAR
jgi:hypothetical protein